jgi:hypothetical protein
VAVSQKLRRVSILQEDEEDMLAELQVEKHRRLT